MSSKVRSYFRIAVFLILVVVVAAMAAIALSLLLLRPDGQTSDSSYELLDLSREEQAQVDRVYAEFETERTTLLDEFHQLQGRLARLLQEEEGYSPRVAETVRQLHEIHADLQEVSIQRFFAVLEVLPPEKRKELRQLAADTLSQPE